MNVEKFAEEAFKIDPKLRYVGIVDNQFHVLVSKMRVGVQSVTTDEQERNFVQIVPPIIVDAIEKLEALLGRMEHIKVRYEKVVLFFFRVEGLVVTLSFDPEVETPFATSVSNGIRKIAAQYLRE
jgi:hypothetical protein